MRHPDITVQLSGENGNALVIMGRVSSALKANGVNPEEIKEFRTEAMSGDYQHVLRTCHEWVDVA